MLAVFDVKQHIITKKTSIRDVSSGIQYLVPTPVTHQPTLGT